MTTPPIECLAAWEALYESGWREEAGEALHEWMSERQWEPQNPRINRYTLAKITAANWEIYRAQQRSLPTE